MQRTIATSPIVLGFTILLSLILLSQLGSVLGRYSIENLQYEAEAMQQWHHQVEEVYDYEGSHIVWGNTDSNGWTANKSPHR